MNTHPPDPLDRPKPPPSLDGQIDRISPRMHPQGRVVMHQKWSDLLFLHWPIPAAELRPLLPPGLVLDLFEGTAYVGLVPFRMSGVRPVGLPAVPRLSNFCETNVRTYVQFQGRDPGVWFFSLDAANAIAVQIARSWFHLPYHYARLFLEEESPNFGRAEVAYGEAEDTPIVYGGTRRGTDGSLSASYAIRARPEGPPRSAIPGTLEHFLVERYILYTTLHGKIHRGYVHHSPYPVQNAQTLCFSESLLAANRIQCPAIPPICHFARGVDVKVFNLHPAPI